MAASVNEMRIKTSENQPCRVSAQDVDHRGSAQPRRRFIRWPRKHANEATPDASPNPSRAPAVLYVTPMRGGLALAPRSPYRGVPRRQTEQRILDAIATVAAERGPALLDRHEAAIGAAVL